ncbi:heptaprenyl diphosphate synthase component 1 [Paenibacillus larvae]
MYSYRIPEIAKKYTEYDMIQKHTNLPEFPEFRTRLLYAFLNGDSNLTSSGELFTLVTSLVQIGLDTHDLVSVTNEKKEKKASRSRQLKVLAGDYFSSHFYNLLSEAGQIELIKRISQSICEVNRLKVLFYQKVKQFKLTAEDYISETVRIKTVLFQSFATLMEEMHHRVWPDILEGFTRCEVLFKEIFRADHVDEFAGSWAYWHIIQNGSKDERKQLQTEEKDPVKIRSLIHKYGVPSQLYEQFVVQWKQLYAKMKTLDSEKLASELFHISEPFHRFLSKPKILEEM